MATTPNYGWVTPAPTDFVTDLPADFETFADAVDDTVKDLNPGTTAGDLDYYTSSTAKARLGIGTAGQVLAVNSGATAPQWVTPASAGGMEVIASGTLPLGGTTLTLTSIPTTFKNLQLVIRNHLTQFNGGNLRLRMNADTGSNRHVLLASYGAVTNVSFNDTRWQIVNSQAATTSTSLIVVNILDYANTTTMTIGDQLTLANSTSAGTINFIRQAFAYNQTTAITSIEIINGDGFGWDLTNPGTYILYGVK